MNWVNIKNRFPKDNDDGDFIVRTVDHLNRPSYEEAYFENGLWKCPLNEYYGETITNVTHWFKIEEPSDIQ